MALIRGGKSLFPCPICLVPHDKIVNMSCSWPKRSQEETKALVENKLNNRSKTAAADLKNQGLRPVQVEFLQYLLI